MGIAILRLFATEEPFVEADRERIDRPIEIQTSVGQFSYGPLGPKLHQARTELKDVKGASNQSSLEIEFFFSLGKLLRIEGDPPTY